MLADLQSGAYFGEQALVPEGMGYRSTHALALQATRLLEIKKTLFDEVTRNDSHILEKIQQLGVEQLHHRLAQDSALFRSIRLGEYSGDWLTEEKFKAGEIIFHEGDTADKFYLILWGKAEVSQQKNRSKKALSQLGPGQYFGELALINQEPRLATITAHTDLLTLTLSGKKFLSLHSDNPQLRSQLKNLGGIWQTGAK